MIGAKVLVLLLGIHHCSSTCTIELPPIMSLVSILSEGLAYIQIGSNPPVQNLDDILPRATIDYESLSISGLSSGATMAMQYHMSHSSEVNKVGMFAGVTYGTFHTNILDLHGVSLAFFAGAIPFTPIPIQPYSKEAIEAQANSWANQGLIDETGNITGSRVYIFHGTADPVVNNVYGIRNAEFYNDYGAILKTKLTLCATHTVPTDNKPTSLYDCPAYTFLSINNCDYEGVFDMFSHLLGSDYQAPISSNVLPSGSFYMFNQTPYTATENPSADFMGPAGYLYVPTYCQNPLNTCKIHIALHGCLSNIANQLRGNSMAKLTGYFLVADVNNMVIVFPQAKPQVLELIPGNTLACWDFFDGTTTNSFVKSAPQIISIRKISRAVAKLSF